VRDLIGLETDFIISIWVFSRPGPESTSNFLANLLVACLINRPVAAANDALLLTNVWTLTAVKRNKNSFRKSS